MATRCTVCRGQKQYAAMGGIYKPCTNCNGIGYIPDQVIDVINTQNDKPVEPIVIKKKAGRPKVINANGAVQHNQ